MSKLMTKCFAAFAALALAIACVALVTPSQAFAYEYQVRVFGGNDWGDGLTTDPGNFDVIDSDSRAYGKVYDLPLAEARANLSEDSKYYVKACKI